MQLTRLTQGSKTPRESITLAPLRTPHDPSMPQQRMANRNQHRYNPGQS